MIDKKKVDLRLMFCKAKEISFIMLVLFSMVLGGGMQATASESNYESDLEALRGNSLKQTGSVSGFITEAGSGEALIGANVIVKGTLKGTATDIDGAFTIRNIEVGDKVLVVSYLGFKSKEVNIAILEGENIEIQIELEWEGVTGEEVTVTAQARGQISAINQQLASNTIANVVAKDRIQELPDVNAAESIGRLPGVSLQRSGGEANKVVVRGLSPKYNTVTINGVRVPSTDTDNRSVDLSLVSSGMLDGIEVTKALTADKDADAIGGSVDLKLRTAPKGFAGSLQLQGGYTALQKTYDNYNISGSISNRFFEDKLGIIVNLNTDRYDRSADILNGNYGLKLVNNSNIVVVNSLNLNENSNTRERIGGSIIGDYELPNGKITYNTIYNNLTNSGFGRNNIMNVASDVHTYTMSDYSNTTFILTNALNIEQDFGWISYDVGVSGTSSESKSPEDYYWEFREESAREAVLEDTLALYDVPTIFRNDLDRTGFFGLNKTFRVTNEDQAALQFNIEVPLSIGENVNGFIKSGGKFRRLERTNDRNQLISGNDPYYGGGANFRRSIALALPELGIDTDVARLPIEAFLDDYTRNNFLDGDFDIGYTPRAELMRVLTQVAEDSLFLRYSNFQSGGRDYTGDEEYNALYTMAKLDLGKYITFIPGVRWEQEKTKYTANFITSRVDPPAGTELTEVYRDTTSNREADFLLPMVHLQIKPSEVVTVRLAYTETISRPDYRQYAPITFYSPISNFANAPNPNLKTSKSFNYDASISIYQNKVGLLTISGFYKEIENLISGASFNLIEGQNILPGLFIEEAGSKAPSVNTSINLPEPSTIKGYEIDWQTNFWYLPSLFKGLVLNINYTHISSEAEYPTFELLQVPIEPRPRRPPFTTSVLKDTTFTSTLPDQPSDILNVTLGYDFKGFSGRVSMLYQSKTTTGSFGRQFESADDLFVDDYLRIDVSLQQKIQADLQVYANLNNLNNRQDVRLQSNTDLYPTRKEYYGFTMDVGVRYKF